MSHDNYMSYGLIYHSQYDDGGNNTVHSTVLFLYQRYSALLPSQAGCFLSKKMSGFDFTRGNTVLPSYEIPTIQPSPMVPKIRGKKFTFPRHDLNFLSSNQFTFKTFLVCKKTYTPLNSIH